MGRELGRLRGPVFTLISERGCHALESLSMPLLLPKEGDGGEAAMAGVCPGPRLPGKESCYSPMVLCEPQRPPQAS